MPGGPPDRTTAPVPRSAQEPHPSAPWEGQHLPSGVYPWAVLCVTVLGAILRLAHLARPFNGVGATGWNEGHYALIALNFDRYGLWSQHNELGVDYTFSPGVPWLIWLAFKAFGPSEGAARVPIALFGIAAIPLVAAVVRRLLASEQIAFGAAAFAAAIPETVYFSQNVQLDTPSICCALGGAVAILRYRDTGGRKELVAAGVWVTLAVWFKFTTALLYPAYLAMWWPASPGRTWAAAGRAVAFAGLTALPSVAWILYGRLTHQTLAGFYQRNWDPRGLIEVLIELPLMLATHVFPIVFILLVLGIPIAFRWRARLRGLGLWCCSWALLYALAPYSALTNRYYDLPATYLLTAPTTLGLWMPLARRRSGGALARAVVISLGLLVALLAAYDLWDPTTDRLARSMTAHPPPLDPSPFYSAKIVARLPRKRTVVDAPQTMFYAGGDPEWISIVGGDGDVREAIDAERFDYILLNDYWHQQPPYYVVDEALRARLGRHHYVQIAPAAWARTSPR
jgi:4-amino-4-deoxy-L-arabinose transferase-like glycosyltransferase